MLFLYRYNHSQQTLLPIHRGLNFTAIKIHCTINIQSHICAKNFIITNFLLLFNDSNIILYKRKQRVLRFMKQLSYDKLWSLLGSRKMRKKDLQTQAHLSSVTIAKLGKNENVSTDVLLRICNALNCNLPDIVSTVDNIAYINMPNDSNSVANDTNYNCSSNKQFKVVDLFAGVGGLSYGFAHNPAFKIVMANEYDKNIATAYSLNNPSVNMLSCDIKDLGEDLIFESAGYDIDVIVGGPPCQSYSTLGKRQMDDRAHLFEEYCRILSIVEPKIFIFENVSGLLSMQNGNLIHTIVERFSNLGYDVKYRLLNAVNYGVPQHRERVILVGTKASNTFHYPAPTHGVGLKPYLTVEDAFSDLPRLRSGESGNNYATAPQNEYQKYLRANCTKLTENNAPKNGEHLIRIMQALPDGGNRNDLPIELRPQSGYGNTYAKLWWKKPSTTITRNFATPSSSRCIHPRDSRAMTTREGARLQSFPDDYKFFGATSTKNLEIGNAVPPLLSVRLAEEVLAFLQQ